MTLQSEARETLLDLLVSRATEGLDASDETRAETLLHSEPDLHLESFDLAAASLDLAVDAPTVPLPDTLRIGLVSQAAAHYSRPSEDAAIATTPGAAPRSAPPATNVVSFRRQAAGEAFSAPVTSTEPSFDWTKWGGWIAAAAIAGFVFGLRALTPPAPTPEGSASKPASAESVVVEPIAERTVADRRSDLIKTASDLRRIDWSATEHPLGGAVSGDVIWSDSAQEGYMTFQGLAWNDPAERQYQLWVFDATRSEEHPVDGGVFDIPASSGEVIVPIDPKIRVDEATLFAITLERPGGVVVSSREDLVLIAPVA